MIDIIGIITIALAIVIAVYALFDWLFLIRVNMAQNDRRFPLTPLLVSIAAFAVAAEMYCLTFHPDVFRDNMGENVVIEDTTTTVKTNVNVCE